MSQKLQAEQIDFLVSESMKTVRKFRKGETLFAQHSPFDGIFLIKSGLVKITQTDASDKDVVFWLMGKGEFLGLSSFSHRDSYLFTAHVASKTCTAAYLSPQHIDHLMETSHEAKLAFVHLLCERVGFIEQQKNHLFAKTAKERLRETLLFLAIGRKFPKNVKRRIRIAQHKENIAYIAGIRLEYLNKLLKDFQRNGVVELDGKAFTINLELLLSDSLFT